MEPQGIAYLIPYLVPAVIKNGTPMGRGKLYLVTQAAGGTATITHNLGRIPQFLFILDNGSGQLGDRTISSRTATQIAFSPTVNLSSAVVWVF